uniref:Uncharacterized protein n=1 Tax=viral metagenome TaxID=1070528 RepID=A0A6M3KXV2_9ZZZZ
MVGFDSTKKTRICIVIEMRIKNGQRIFIQQKFWDLANFLGKDYVRWSEEIIGSG